MNDLEWAINIAIFAMAFMVCMPVALLTTFVVSTTLKLTGKLDSWKLPIMSGLAFLVTGGLAAWVLLR